MRVPKTLTKAFDSSFEENISRFIYERELIPDPKALSSVRFLTRSLVPHILKLSQLFNRLENDGESGLKSYWKASSNPANLQLAYFTYFMPCNLFRVAAVWTELSRLGLKWSSPDELKAVEFGAGPATGACGIAAGERALPLGLPRNGYWALIEQDKSILETGRLWASSFFQHNGFENWNIRKFHRTIDPSEPLLPPRAPKFNLLLMSYFLNEASIDVKTIAGSILASMEKHLEEEGLIVLIEPALKTQSRRLIELRNALIIESKNRNQLWLKVLLPCLGHHSCKAMADPEDWCHEEVMWNRPNYIRVLDDMAGLDHKTLPFSYLVLTKSNRTIEEILPFLKCSDPSKTYRLVSPSYRNGKDIEFFVCGKDGKRRARFKTASPLERGDILLDTEIRGDKNASRITGFTRDSSKEL